MAVRADCKVVGTNLVITVDISPETVAAAEPSASGKTRTIATTGGFDWATGIKGLGYSLTVSTKS